MKETVVLVILVTVLITLTNAKYCLYGDDPGCAFECHCAVEAECEGSGVCTSGCEQTGITLEVKRSWTGDTCQIGNIASMKHANQTTDWKHYIASNAVDGKTSADLEFCTHTNTSQITPGQWWLDLGGLYKIYNVTIYNRKKCCQHRLGYINVSVIGDHNQETTCDRLDQEPTSDPIVLTCQSPLVGQYIHIARYGGSEIHFLTVCEVIVTGHRYVDCKMADCPTGVVCNEVTGCSECIGTYPPYCKTECDNGNFGTNCEEMCGNCQHGTACNKKTGSCPQGCQLWWVDAKCMTPVDLPTITKETITDIRPRSNSVGLKWQPLAFVPQGLTRYYQYSVQFKEKQMTLYKSGPVVRHRTDLDLAAVVVGLRPNTEYDVIVVPQRVMRGVAEGNPDSATYDPVSVKTLCNVPDVSQMNLRLTASRKDPAEIPKIIVTFQILWTLDHGCETLRQANLEYKVATASHYRKAELDIFDDSFVIKPTVWGRYEVRISLTNDQNLTSIDSKFIQLGDDVEQTTTLSVECCSSCPRPDTNAVLYLYVLIALGVLLAVFLGIIIALALMLWRKKHKAKHRNSENEAEAVNSPHKLPDEMSEEISLEKVEPQTQPLSYDALKNRKTSTPGELNTYEEL